MTKNILFICLVLQLMSRLFAIEEYEGTPIVVGTAIQKTTKELMDEGKIDDLKEIKPFRQKILRTTRLSGYTRANNRWPYDKYSSVNVENQETIDPLFPMGIFASNPPVNFTVVTLADTGAFPPDSMGVIGPTQFITACNGRIRSFTKAGVADGVLNVSTDSFFSSVLQAGAFTSDPRLKFDRLTNRWFLIMISVPTNFSPNQIVIAVSNGPTITPSTVWSFYQFRPSLITPARSNPLDFTDFPTLGLDQYALYIGGNIFSGSTGNFTNCDAFVINKASLVNSGILTVTAFRNLIDSNGVGPSSPQGVDVFDTTATQGFFIGTDNSEYGQLILRTVTNPGTTPIISGNIFIPVLSTADPLLVPHPGNNNGTAGYLSAVDDRLTNSHVRSNFLYTCHNISVNNLGVSGGGTTPTRNGCRWYRIDVSSPCAPVLSVSGTVYTGSATNDNQQRHFWMPSMITNGLQKMILGCSAAGPQAFINAAATQLTLNGGFTSPYYYTNTVATYNPPGDPGGPEGRRWGDYSHASVDPSDDMTIWLINEFCNANNSYGVQVASIPSPMPATLLSICPNPISTNIASTALTITGKSVNGSGFFDPGSSFANRLQVTIEDVQVLSTTYVSPTQIDITVSTVGTSLGYKDVIVTNPDGQSVTGFSMLNIVP